MSMLTMKTIMQTFSEMIEEMPFDKITVLALVKRCEINHNTFYYHFQDLYELLDKWIQYEIDKLVKTLEDPTDLKAEMKAIFQACKEYPKIINHILSSLSKEQLEYHFFIKTEDSISKYIKSSWKMQENIFQTNKSNLRPNSADSHQPDISLNLITCSLNLTQMNMLITSSGYSMILSTGHLNRENSCFLFDNYKLRNTQHFLGSNHILLSNKS